MRPASLLLIVVLGASLVTACGGVAEELLPLEAAAGARGADVPGPTDGEIRQLIINDSIAAYDGNRPCPYNLATDGSLCGKRSAYSRNGGAWPLCYPQNVTDAMVEAYRDGH